MFQEEDLYALYQSGACPSVLCREVWWDRFRRGCCQSNLVTACGNCLVHVLVRTWHNLDSGADRSIQNFNRRISHVGPTRSSLVGERATLLVMASGRFEYVKWDCLLDAYVLGWQVIKEIVPRVTESYSQCRCKEGHVFIC